MTRQRTGLLWAVAISLVLTMVLPFFAGQNIHAAGETVTARVIEMLSSETDAETTYDINFTVPDVGTETPGSFMIEFCDNDPLPHTTCTVTSGDNVPDLDATDGTSSTAANCNTCSNFNSNAVTLQVPASGDNDLSFDSTAADLTGAQPFDVTIDNVDNPSNTTDTATNNGFYARIYVFNVSTAPAYANPMPTTNVLYTGGVALSTAQTITLDARVQETLNFCVGTIVTTDGDCSTVTGTGVDLGVIDQTGVTESDTLDTTSGTANCDFDDTNECAVLIVSTNATNAGVDVDYITNTGFQVGTGVCDSGTTAGGSETDQCLNPVHESAETSLVAGDEAWGQAVVATTAHASSTTNTNLTGGVEAVYDHASGGYAVDDGGTSINLADSNNGTAATNVVDREQLEIAYAATAAITTPAGAYQVELVYVASGTF